VEALAGMMELARLFGLSRQRIQQLAVRPGFPEPLASLEMGKVWWLPQVLDWAIRTNRPVPGLSGHTVAAAPLGRRAVVGAAELARQFGVGRQRVQQIAAKPGFPRPAATLTMGRLWYADECRAWDRARKGGPATSKAAPSEESDPGTTT